MKKRVSKYKILCRLIKYAINPRAWDDRLHLAFLNCSDGYLQLFEKRKQELGCGCTLHQIKAGVHCWILELDYTNCRDHTCGDECKGKVPPGFKRIISLREAAENVSPSPE